MRFGAVVALLLVAVLGGCRSAGRSAQSVDPTQSSVRDVISREDLARAQGSMFDVVQQLRPRWLMQQSLGSSTVPICLYLDELRRVRGDVETELRNLTPANYASLRYWSPVQASFRFSIGAEENCSVIQVLTR